MSGWLKCQGLWREPSTNSSFRQRCASALTHPATVVALGILLLNDLVFKSMWPDAWATGKLSDLAWMAFAPPLLAFLLSFLARRNSRVEKASWTAAYVGLPLLYAAFNTFEPVHDWILRGLSIASGRTSVSPLDVTDSVVIPLGMVIAVRVWRQRVAGPAAQRLRWGLLVAGVAALASVATSPTEPDYGITKVGVSAEGIIYASGSRAGTYASHDGGLNWTVDSTADLNAVKWASSEVDTPRGRFRIDGSRIMRGDAAGRWEQVYSTAYLRKAANVWVQKHGPDLPIDAELATRPLAIVYDDRSDNVTVALGVQGVIVGTPDGRWERIAVGEYSPTDFSFAAKTHLLLSRLDFWVLAVVLSLTMTGAAQFYSWQWDVDRDPSDTGRRFVLVLLAVLLTTVIAWMLLRVFSNNGLFVSGTVELIGLLFLTPVLVATAICSMTLSSNVRRGLAWSIGILTVIGSCTLLAIFGGTDADDYFFFLDNAYLLVFSVVSVPAFTLGATAIAVSCPQLKYRPVVGAALMGMIVLIFLALMLWLHLGIALGLAKVSAFVLTALVAFLLAGYLRGKTVRPDPETRCPNCRQANSALAPKCYICGLPLKPNDAKP